MTTEEARNLQVGDYVETMIGRKWMLVVVEDVIISSYSTQFHSMSNVFVRVRRPGRTSNGRRYSSYSRLESDLRKSPYDAVTANVFADWLVENDEPRAAAKLRERFPFLPKKSP